MKPDDKTLIDALRGADHDDVADALDRKLRPAEEPAEEPAQRPAPRTQQEANEQLLGDIKAMSAGGWSSAGPLFGE